MSALLVPAGQLVLELDQIAAEIHRVWDETKAHQVAAWEGYLSTGRLLAQARLQLPDNIGYGRWFDAQDFGFSLSWASRLRRLAEQEPAVRETFGSALPNDDPLGVDAMVALLRDEHNGNGLAPLMSSDTAEWYTPQHVVHAVMAAMGGIDLDPCAEPARSIPAHKHFTEADDGLNRPWNGRVYMNPPYGKTIGAWVDKLADEYDAGNVTEAIALVPARTDTSWWAHLPSSAVCFVSGRLAFSDHVNPAPFPSAACYLGKNERGFAEAFWELGLIYVRLELAVTA